MALFCVATPSESYILEPDLPGVLALSMIVSPSENIFFSRLPSRNDIFCWIAEAFSALIRGETSLDATVPSTIILYLPLLRLRGPIWLIALSKAVCEHSFSLSTSK